MSMSDERYARVTAGLPETAVEMESRIVASDESAFGCHHATGASGDNEEGACNDCIVAGVTRIVREEHERCALLAEQMGSSEVAVAIRRLP